MKNLGALQEKFEFDLAFIQEGKRLDGNILPGFKNSVAPSRMGADYDNCRILIRERGTKFIDQGAVKVPGPMWQWNDNKKPTRVIPWEAFERSGQVYVAICIHRVPMGPIPGNAVNRAAWNAEHKAIVALVRELRARFPKAIIILGGDWNAEMDESPKFAYSLPSLAEDLKANVRILHIDGLMVIGGKPKGVHKLERLYGSDKHRPVLGTVVPA